MKVLVIDNNDSFTYNLIEILRKNENLCWDVLGYDELSTKKIKKYNKLIISPGPDVPKKYLKYKKVIDYCIKKDIHILGICLGHQILCEYFGCKLKRLKKISHGKEETISIDNSSKLYKTLPKQIKVGLYHSWKVKHNSMPSFLKVTAMADYLMSFEHESYQIYGVQFHPESFISDCGDRIVGNFLEI